MLWSRPLVFKLISKKPWGPRRWFKGGGLSGQNFQPPLPPHPVGQQKYYLIDVLYMLDFQVEFLFNNEIQYWKQKIGNLCRRVREFNICISKWVAFWLMFLPSWASNRESPAPSSSLPPPPNGDQSLEERWAEVYASNWAPMLWALHTHTQRSYCLGLSSWRMFSVLAWAVESCWLMQARVRGGGGEGASWLSRLRIRVVIAVALATAVVQVRSLARELPHDTGVTKNKNNNK